VDGPGSVSGTFSGLALGAVRGYDPASGALTSPTQVTVGQADWVEATAASPWTPPLPRDPTMRFVYDGDGGRVKATGPGGTTTFLGQSYEVGPVPPTFRP